MRRPLCTTLVGTVLAGPLLVLASGCGGTNELEKPPEVTKQMDPMESMPGYKEMQEKLKKEGKIKK
jgi:hypothetical protein